MRDDEKAAKKLAKQRKTIDDDVKKQDEKQIPETLAKYKAYFG